MADQEMSVTRSSRDPEQLRSRLQAWLERVLPAGAAPEVTSLTIPESTGMSSETLLFDATWTESAERASHALVARVAPDLADVPVFPTYDLELQFEAMRLVREHTDVPVPDALWLELDPEALGAPFFVMERVEGRVPPDVMPYNIDSWLLEADAADQRSLQDASVRVLAAIHRIDPAAHDTAFLELDVAGATPLRRHVEHTRHYYDWVRGERHFPVVEDTFAWLEENWPTDEGDTVVSWGDSRIGNILYDEFTPAAVLDWEMAAIGTRGVDVAWMIFLHSFFEFVAGQLDVPGMPHFLRREDVLAVYEEASGTTVPDLGWYEVYAGLRHGVVMARIFARQVRFGEAEWPDDLDEAILHAPLMRAMIDG